MIIRDVMPAFELYQPTQLRDAFALLDRFGKDAWKMAGGYDSLSWFKDRIKRPKAVVDISGIAELKGIRETADGVEIGALETLTTIERHPVIKAKYRVLADAAAKVAAPQTVEERLYASTLAINGGKYEEAIQAINRVTDFRLWHCLYLASAHAHLGLMEQARASVERLLQIHPDFRLSQVALIEPFRDPADLAHLTDGLHRAGLPE